VLWVKGSGGDSASIKLDGFSTLYMEKLRALKGLYRGLEHEDEMVGYLPHCTFNLNPRAASIDTPLHAYVPKPCRSHAPGRDHRHCCLQEFSRELTQQIFGDDHRLATRGSARASSSACGFRKFCAENPNAKGLILESHGLFTWGDTAKECYETTIEIINQAIAWFETQTDGNRPSAAKSSRGRRQPSAAPLPQKLMPDSRPDLGRRAQAWPFRRQPGRARIRHVQQPASRWQRSAPPAPTTSCAPRSARW
jgi:rhamnose utilization protein RhaD (predicted bifunctional aldolase and dehydrogenase)